MATVRLQLRRGTSSEWDTANPTLAAGEIGIETDTNTFKFGDGQTQWNDLSYALSDTVDDYVLLSTKGVANGVASLDSSGFVPASQLPPLAKVTVSAVANVAARLALTAEAGDIAIQSDNGQSYVLSASPASTDSNWKALVGSEAVVDTVESSLVAGAGLDKTYDDAAGTITIDIDSTVATKTYADQAEADAISTAAADATTKANAAQAAAEATAAADATTKANAAQSAASSALASHESDTTNVHGISDTSILATTSGTQTLTNKTLTSPVINTPTGIVKADIGLGNVDNTADMDKPVSYASLAALALKAPLASPGITGNATAENLTISGNLIVNGTTSTINSTTLTIQDKDIVLGQTSSPTDSAANGGGIVLKGTTDKSITYNVANSSWDLSENINIPSGKTITINNVPVLSINQVLGKSLPGEVVGTTETQVLSNKTLEAPVINGTISLPSTTSIGDVSSSEIALLNGVTANVQTQIDAKSPTASPTFTGTVTLPSATSIGDVSATEIALLNGVTANVQTQIDAKAPLASPTFTGTVTLPSETSIGSVSSTELELLNGVTANVQTQIDAKLASTTAASTYAPLVSPTFSGTVTLPSSTSIGDVSLSELAFLDGVTSNVQTQINAKAPSASPTFSGTVTLPSTTSIGSVSSTELELLNGVTANVQTQIDAKAPLASPTFTGTVTLPSETSIGSVSSIELELLNGVTANVQTQIDAKAPSASPTFTGTVILPTGTITSGMIADGAVATTDIADVAVSTGKIADAAVTTAKIADDSITSAKIVAGTIINSDINAAAAIDWTKLAVSSTVDATELGYVNGVTSSIQAQIDTKLASATAASTYAPLASPTFTGTVTTGHVLPATDNTFDLGSPTNMWKDIYVGPGSLYVNGQKVLQDESGAIVVSADINENLGLRTSGSGNIEFDPTGTGSINIKGPVVVEAGANFSSADGNGIGFSNGLKSDTLTSRNTDTDLSLSANGTGKVYLNDNAEVNGNLVVGGNLTVSGTTTTVNSETISLADNIIDLNSNFTTGTPTENAGIKIKRGDSSDVQIRWNESTDKWEITNDGTNYSSIAGLESPTFTGTVSGITKTMVGLGNVDNTTDAAKPVSTAQATAIATAKAEAIADATSQVNAVIAAAPAALNTLDELAAALGDDANFATTITTSLAAKAPLASPTFTGTVSGITKTMVGLANVDNTSDANKPVSTATQTALDLKAPLASPTFTGTVSGITKTMVGLGNVDNTTDAAKPVSTAQATAIATAKAEAIADATAQVNALVTGAPAAMNTLDELAAALGDDANFAASVTTSLGLKVDSLTPISQKSASYTLSSLTERDDLIEMGSSSAMTLTIPTDATLNYPIGTSIDILQTGTGQVTIAAATPGTTTVNATPGLKLRTQWSSCTLLKRAANTWVVFGDLTA